MENKPNDFFVGLVDFFTIVLPGALLAYLLEDLAEKNILGQVLPPIQDRLKG